MKKVIRIIIVLVALIFAVVVVLFAKLQIQTSRILTDYSMIYENKKYSTPEYTTEIHKYLKNADLIDLAYENMPFYFKLAFAIGMFEKNTIFTVSPKS